MNKVTNFITTSLIVAIISFLGFVVENIWLYFTKGYIDNRGMHTPFLLGYGLSAILIYFLFGTPSNMYILGRFLIKLSRYKKILLYIFLCFLAVCIGEISFGFFVEKFIGFEYWNYSRIPLHITKYTSIPTSIGFSLIIFLFMDVCLNKLINIILRIPITIRLFLCIMLNLIMCIDFFKSFLYIYHNKQLKFLWKIQFKNKNKIERYH